MHVVVVGVGFVGGAVSRLLARFGSTFVVTTSTSDRVPLLEEEFRREEYGGCCRGVYLLGESETKPTGDDTDLQRKEYSYDDILSIETPDAIVVTVAPGRTRHGRSGVELYEKTYRETCAKIVSSAQIYAPRCHIIYASSTSVYPTGDEERKQGRAHLLVTEETECVVRDSYGKVLIEAETILLQSSLPTCILRYAELYGPPNRELRSKCERMSEMILPGDGSNIVNLTHVDDASRAILFVLERSLIGTFNVVSPSYHPSRKEMLETLGQAFGLKAPVFDPTLQSSHGGYRIISSEKLIENGYEFSVDTVQF